MQAIAEADLLAPVVAQSNYLSSIHSPGAGNDAAGSTTHVAYARIADGFGPGAIGLLIAVADTSGHAAIERLAAEIAATATSAGVVPRQCNEARDTACSS